MAFSFGNCVEKACSVRTVVLPNNTPSRHPRELRCGPAWLDRPAVSLSLSLSLSRARACALMARGRMMRRARFARATRAEGSSAPHGSQLFRRAGRASRWSRAELRPCCGLRRVAAALRPQRSCATPCSQRARRAAETSVGFSRSRGRAAKGEDGGADSRQQAAAVLRMSRALTSADAQSSQSPRRSMVRRALARGAAAGRDDGGPTYGCRRRGCCVWRRKKGRARDSDSVAAALHIINRSALRRAPRRAATPRRACTPRRSSSVVSGGAAGPLPTARAAARRPAHSRAAARAGAAGTAA